MRTIERNYRKNPHTARFLMAFHAAAYGHATEVDDNAAEYALAQGDGAPAADLLDLVPAETPAFSPSAKQTAWIDDMIREIEAGDADAGRQAKDYTVKMIGHWTPGKDGNLSRWIDRLIAKRDAVRAAARRAPAPVAPTASPEIPANNYGIQKDGEVKCYQVDHGRVGTKWEGFTFLNRISSDDRFPIRNGEEKAFILAEIAADVDAARILAATTLRQCSHCHRELSDTKNPYFSIGLGPKCGAK